MTHTIQALLFVLVAVPSAAIAQATGSVEPAIPGASSTPRWDITDAPFKRR